MENETLSLKKVISWQQGAAMTIGAVLGSGILILPVAAAEISGPASLISWALMGLLAIPLTTVLGILGSRYPDAGGIAAYTRRAFGETVGAATATLFLGTVPIGGPVAALIGANYLGSLFALSDQAIYVIAACMLVLAIFFNYWGIQLSGKVQVGVIILIAVILLVVVIAALPQVEMTNYIPFAPNGWLAVGSAMTMLFWAFVGWEMIVHLSEEFKNPAKDIPRSLAAALGVVNLLYFGVAFVTIGTGAYLGANNGAALATMIGNGWGKWAGVITGIIGFLVCYGTIHTYVAGFSRLIYSQARSGVFPEYFSHLNATYKTPDRVLLALGLVFFIVIAFSYSNSYNIAFLMQLPSSIFIALYILAMAAAVKLFFDNKLLRYCALVSLITCTIIYAFTSWVGLYPIILGGVGLCLKYFKKQTISKK
ncbi:amino acid permease [Dendrosporobacter sp. 1207_IL3150]|uniref:amino acid permease n=1 Tax=Dendrosporobacter sp. 1207_IL3150 TaxID=3084054 RepID=UPI002FD8EBA9